MEGLVAPAINFAIFAGLMFYFLKSPVKQMLVERHQKLREDIETTRTQLTEAQKKFQEFSRRIQNLDSEVTSIVQQAREEAESSKVKIITEAKRMADTIVIDAKRGSEGIVAEFKSQIRADLAQQMITRAEQMIRQKLSEDDRERLRRDFSRQVEGSR